MDVLDTLGAFDRMEIIPLLRTKAVVFVENRDDKNYLKAFAIKRWGELKAAQVWEGLSFLYTYQEPIAADVKLLARQVKDLLNAPSLGGLAKGTSPRFLVIGDRDYRSKKATLEAKKELEQKAQSNDFKLDLNCRIWQRNEIENYLLDPRAIEEAVISRLASPDQEAEARAAIKEMLPMEIEKLKAAARVQIGSKLQQQSSEYRGDFAKTTKEVERILAEEWGEGFALCDAKKLLSSIRAGLQTRKIRAKLVEEDIIVHMQNVPEDVEHVLRDMYKLALPAFIQRAKPMRRAAVKKARPKSR
jgi:hypothetical protein